MVSKEFALVLVQCGRGFRVWKALVGVRQILMKNMAIGVGGIQGTGRAKTVF